MKPYLGDLNHFCDYCEKDFADILKPISAMTKAKAVLRWTKDCAVSFEAVKERILKRQKLYFMDYDLPIDVQVKALELGCGR